MTTYYVFRHNDPDSDWTLFNPQRYRDSIEEYGNILLHLNLVPNETQYDPILFPMGREMPKKMRDTLEIRREYNLKYIIEITDACRIREANGLDMERFLRF